MEELVSARALRESEELHRITLINMSDAVFITDDEGVFTFVCPNADIIFGYSQDEVRSMGLISRLLGCDLIDPWQLAPNGEVRNIEHEIAAKGGVRRALLVHIKRVSIKGGTILYVCRDITERKQAEQDLRRNEERLKLALEAASAGTWDWHVPSGEMTWSPETADVWRQGRRSIVVFRLVSRSRAPVRPSTGGADDDRGHGSRSLVRDRVPRPGIRPDRALGHGQR